ncbi:patatin-like phospholipase family protein [Roseicitreum antarcticum]|uniref:NTE family protein n=1 Tax=Roseicitreum antarcticum TaxID=564137 RepID=A0A1H2XXI5_9RHOB|nr:patatin-like phospholipase family protein [Roseicitreum antarcticum]SDW97633.1 NTE family protein [Roseicitreum antarcticum]
MEKPNTSQAPKPVTLALQGGGSHGALTWGVLDRILEDPRISIAEISGTSAGAMNAIVLADGYESGGREGARRALHDFWKAISDMARFSPIQRTPLDRLVGNYNLDASPGYLFFEGMSRMFSPYDLNPAEINPLRDLLERQVNFDRVNRCRDIKVHVTATNVRSGQARIFSRGGVTLDAIMASACLPQIYPAVEIDGQHYWDGGFSGNPALLPLIETTSTADVIIVQINPVIRRDLPMTAREIINRTNEISFNTALIKELRAIHLMQRLIAAEGLDVGPAGHTYLHLIHADEELQDLAASSKMNAEWSYLELLFGHGRRWADQWLETHFDAIGERGTLDLDGLFRDPATPTAPDPHDKA